MLLGHDISKWNSGIDVNTGDFTMMKVTEGVTYTDPKCAEYVRQSNDEQLLGCYHFLRADNEKKGNTPAKEAKNFINQVSKLGLLYKAVLVVDYEAGSIGHEDYLLNFLNCVYNATGIRPLVYCSGSVTNSLKKVAAAGYKLWVAHYGVAKPTVYNWTKWTMWQFTSKPWDVDLFDGTRSDWYRLANKA